MLLGGINPKFGDIIEVCDRQDGGRNGWKKRKFVMIAPGWEKNVVVVSKGEDGNVEKFDDHGNFKTANFKYGRAVQNTRCSTPTMSDDAMIRALERSGRISQGRIIND